MRVLLIGPHPPPHGGISVHVSGIQRQLMAAGVTCSVLDMSRVRPGLRFGLAVLRHAIAGMDTALSHQWTQCEELVARVGMRTGRTISVAARY